MAVTVYTNPNCVQCDMTKKRLDKHGIPYSTIDLSQDSEALKMVQDLGFTSAPVVITDTDKWAGFKLANLDNLSKQFHANSAH